MDEFTEEKKKIKLIQDSIFPIICEIDRFCGENGIKYYLCSGTCLGAVRHQGFIPWDYDADIMFPRKDYETFLKKYAADPDRKYEIGSLETDPTWKQYFARMWDKETLFRHKNLEDNDIGACVDLYPIDGFPDHALPRWFFLKRMRTLEILGFCASKTRYHKEEKFVFLKRMLHVIVKPIGWRYFSLRMNALAQKYPVENAKYTGVGIAPGYGKREVMECDVYKSEIRLPFNGLMLSVPEQYDKYLSSLYGDYMSVPEGTVESSYRQVDDWEMTFYRN